MMPMADLFPNVCVRERAKDGHSGTALGPGMMWRPMRRPRTEASSRFGKSPSKPQPQLGRDHLKPGCRTGAGAASIRDVSAAPAPPFANGRAVSRHSHVIAECLTATDPLRKSATWAPQDPAKAAVSDEAPGMPGASSLSIFFGMSVRALARSALGETVGRTVHFQDVDVVGEAVEERAREAFVAERRGPLVEGQVGCDDRALNWRRSRSVG